MAVKLSFDAGHGKYIAGKRAPSGKFEEREWFFNDKILRHCLNYLKKYDVKTFRADDTTGNTDILLPARVKAINAFNPKAHISFHNNAYQSKWGSHGGTEVFHSKGASKTSVELAKRLQPALVSALKTKNRGVKQENFYIIRYVNAPAVLIEFLFMDSNDDIKKLRSNNYLKLAGEAVAKALISQFGLKKKATSTDSTTTSKPTVKPTKLTNNASSVKTKADYKTKSVVTFLQSINEPFSLNDRKKIASYYGMKNYSGSAVQNLMLLDLLIKDHKANRGIKRNKSRTGEPTVSSNKVTTVFKAGKKVKVKGSAKTYSRSTKSIPKMYKNKPYTIQQVAEDDLLIKELYSWIKKKDIA